MRDILETLISESDAIKESQCTEDQLIEKAASCNFLYSIKELEPEDLKSAVMLFKKFLKNKDEEKRQVKGLITLGLFYFSRMDYTGLLSPLFKLPRIVNIEEICTLLTIAASSLNSTINLFVKKTGDVKSLEVHSFGKYSSNISLSLLIDAENIGEVNVLYDRKYCESEEVYSNVLKINEKDWMDIPLHLRPVPMRVLSDSFDKKYGYQDQVSSKDYDDCINALIEGIENFMPKQVIIPDNVEGKEKEFQDIKEKFENYVKNTLKANTTLKKVCPLILKKLYDDEKELIVYKEIKSQSESSNPHSELTKATEMEQNEIPICTACNCEIILDCKRKLECGCIAHRECYIK